MLRKFQTLTLLIGFFASSLILTAQEKLPFPGYPMLEKASTGEWWKQPGNLSAEEQTKLAEAAKGKGKAKGKGNTKPKRLPNLNVPRDEVVAFVVYTQDNGVLKLSGQLFPLFENEAREARLELKKGDT